jgi:REP element-mobilizing transposase RayT
VFVEGGLYHVYNRAARGDAILEADGMAELFVDLLRRTAKRDGLLVYAWCVLPNHYHLVVRSGAVPLSRTMGVVQGRFGQEYNRRFRSAGPLWQSRYKAKLIEDEGYLYQLVAYVHLNPVDAGLVDDPARWRWSGHREIIRRERDSLVEVDEVLAMYGNTIRSARRGYLRTLKGERGESWIGEGPGRLPWWKHEPDSQIEMPVPPSWVDERGVSSGLERPPIDAAEYLRTACKVIGVEPGDLASKRRGETLTDARMLVACVGIERWRQSPKQLAALLGRHADVVTRWARLGAELRLVDQGFLKRAERLDFDVAERKRTGRSKS